MKLKAVLRDKSLHLAAIFLLAAQVIPNIARAQAQPAPPLAGVLGKVQSFTNSSLDVATPTGVIHVKVTPYYDVVIPPVIKKLRSADVAPEGSGVLPEAADCPDGLVGGQRAAAADEEAVLRVLTLLAVA